MVETAGVEPTLPTTVARVCRGLPNVYRISAILRSSFRAFIQQVTDISCDIRLEVRIRLII
jgi:hypothetical protein